MHLKQDIKDMKRFEQIVGVLLRHEHGYILSKLKIKVPFRHRIKKSNAKPEHLRKAFEELGGTFIKLGQLLSLRPDLIPVEYCEEFRKLQDAVPAFSSGDARKIIEEELKQPISKIFSHFNDKPIAAASIGQAHEAVLKNGKNVIIKVQRPGIKKLFDTDMHLLYHLAHLIEKHHPTNLINPTEIVHEFEGYTERELDYVVEAKNADKFYENFRKDKTVIIPKIYWDYTTSKIITLEKIEGLKIDEIMSKPGYNKSKIARHVANMVFKQVFVDGYFHADPHPGNILIQGHDKVVLLDFGIVGRLDPELKENMTLLFISMITGNLDSMVDAMESLDLVVDEVNEHRLKEDLRSYLGKYYDTPLKEVKLSEVFHALITIAKNNNITLPADFVLLGKSLVTVEGFCAELDPDFNIIEEAKPFVKSLKRSSTAYNRFIDGSKNMGAYLFRLPKQASMMMQRVKDADDNIRNIHKDMQSMTTEMERSARQLALGIIIAAVILASAYLMRFDQAKLGGMPLLSLVGFFFGLILLIIFIASIRKK